jgi:hypothetical protein
MTLGMVRNYDDLKAILRARAEALDVSRETIDELAGFSPGYAGRLLGPGADRRLGPATLAAMLGALGIKLIAVEDPEALAKYTARAKRRVAGKSRLENHARRDAVVVGA